MKEIEIPDKNIFMMCKTLDKSAFSELSTNYTIRNCKKEEFAIWKAFPFDNPKEAEDYDQFMIDFFNTTYRNDETAFYNKTLFVCNQNDKPVATCMIWKAYGLFNTIQWFKVLKEAEGYGIGRALLSIILKNLENSEFPVYLHTQPSSFRAIKLYSDFGFDILTDEQIGIRENNINECLPILKEFMPYQFFKQLRFRKAPKSFLDKIKPYKTLEF